MEPEVESALESTAALRRIGLWLGPLLALAALAWPGLELDRAQRGAAAVALLCACWWMTEALPVGITALLPAALFPLLGVLSAEKAAPSYFKDPVMLFLGAMLLALGLERWNLHKRLALAILSFVGAQPRRLVLGFLIATTFVSMWLNNTATALMMLPIALAVARRVAPGEGSSPIAQALLLSVAYAASVGGMGTPVGTAPNQVFLGQFRARYPHAPEIGFGEWILGWAPVLVLWIPIAWLLLTRLALRVPAAGGDARAELRAERAALGPMSSAERRMALVFGLSSLAWITRVDLELGFARLPGWERWLRGSAGELAVSDATVSLLMACLCFLCPAGASGARAADAGGGERLLDWPTARKLPWDVLLLIGGGFCLADGIRASGLDARIGHALGGWMAAAPAWAIVLAVVAAVALFSEIASNTATAQVLLPVLATASESAGINPLATMLPATLAASVGFMLPVATPPNALAFATRLVPMRRMVRVGLWMDLVLVLLIALVYQLWVRPLWGIEAGLPDWASAGR